MQLQIFFHVKMNTDRIISILQIINNGESGSVVLFFSDTLIHFSEYDTSWLYVAGFHLQESTFRGQFRQTRMTSALLLDENPENRNVNERILQFHQNKWEAAVGSALRHFLIFSEATP